MDRIYKKDRLKENAFTYKTTKYYENRMIKILNEKENERKLKIWMSMGGIWY